MQDKPSPPRAKIARAKLLYDGGARIAEVTTLLGMTDYEFRLFRDANGWPLRAPACIRKEAAGGQPDEKIKPKRPPLDASRLIARLEDAVEREFARAESALEKQAPKTIEASARALATLVKTLAELKRMRRETNEKEEATRADDDQRDEPPRELAELRAELARRLERLGGSGETG
ncbi:hypothetical protein [Methylocystis parvus]|uniref:Uncharacterized protein n=1 Tax=Methylocystis parvus TaxID=134 RepID=A0A6B8M1X9_9HYPH|nr:hypothetical protein [Methylocystis parvus]QGM96315.1 hypothetical protein F7D14_01650 [Methylocystis parvus]WBJ99846.1 hypothetical protein MMG94_17975 [Methylocystis parvus OBBP]